MGLCVYWRLQLCNSYAYSTYCYYSNSEIWDTRDNGCWLNLPKRRLHCSLFRHTSMAIACLSGRSYRLWHWLFIHSQPSHPFAVVRSKAQLSQRNQRCGLRRWRCCLCVGHRGYHSAFYHRLGSTHHGNNRICRQSCRNNSNTGPKRCDPTFSAWIRRPTPPSIRRDTAACLGFHQHARIYSPSVLLVRLCSVYRPYQSPGYGRDWFVERRHSSRTTNHWHTQRQMEPNRYGRCSDFAVWSFMLYILASGYIFCAHSGFFNPLWGYRWSLLDGTLGVPNLLNLRCIR